MKPLLQNNHIEGKSIGNWTAQQTPDGIIVWTRKKRLFSKKSTLIGVYATPHLDEPNVVSVDVVGISHDNDRAVLSSRFRLKGELLASDLKNYLIEMELIFSMLK